MNPLTGNAHYLDLGLSPPRPAASIPRVKENLASVVFSDNSYNFDTKFFEEDRQRRQQEFQKKQESFMKRREANVLRDAGRWQTVEEEHRRSLEKLEIKRSKWKAGQKNNASEAFNMITLDYDKTEQGEYLRMKDEEKGYRHALRMFNLDARMNSGFNIITGSTRQPPLQSRYT